MYGDIFLIEFVFYHVITRNNNNNITAIGVIGVQWEGTKNCPVNEHTEKNIKNSSKSTDAKGEKQSEAEKNAPRGDVCGDSLAGEMIYTAKYQREGTKSSNSTKTEMVRHGVYKTVEKIERTRKKARAVLCWPHQLRLALSPFKIYIIMQSRRSFQRRLIE